MFLQLRTLGRFVARLMLVALLVSMPASIELEFAHAQDNQEADAPTEVSVTDAETEPTATLPAEPEIETTEVPSEPVDDVAVETETDPVVEEPLDPATIEVPPPSPSLAFDPTSAPACVPQSGDPSESIVSGGDLALTCTYALALDGSFVDPASIVLDWSVSASVDGDWGVQLLDPTGDPSAWTAPGSSSAALGFQSAYSYDTSVGPLESLQDVATIQFGLLLHRPACVSDPVTLEVDVAGSASIPSSDQAAISSTTAQPLVFTYAPSLAAMDTSLPVVTIVDVAIEPVPFSLSDSQTQGSLTIQVDNATLQCRQSNVLVAVQTAAGSEPAGAAYLSSVGPLDMSSVAGAVPDLSGQGSPLDAFVIVSSVQDRAGAGSYQQTINFDLTIPGATGVGLYQLNASAVVEPAE